MVEQMRESRVKVILALISMVTFLHALPYTTNGGTLCSYPSSPTNCASISRKGLPIIKSWGLSTVDLRGRIFGSHFEGLSPDQLRDLRTLISDYGVTVGCLQSSLAKVHLPEKVRQDAEAQKLDCDYPRG